MTAASSSRYYSSLCTIWSARSQEEGSYILQQYHLLSRNWTSMSTAKLFCPQKQQLLSPNSVQEEDEEICGSSFNGSVLDFSTPSLLATLVFLLHPKPFFNAVYDVWHAELLSLTRAWKPSVPSRLILGGASFSETYRTLGIAQHKMSIGIEVSICYSSRASSGSPPPQLSYYASLLQTPQRVH